MPELITGAAPCPFCGKDVIAYDWKADHLKKVASYRACCLNCLAMGPKASYSNTAKPAEVEEAKQRAAKWWNERQSA